MNSAANTSFNHELNESPVSIILCSTSTQWNDGPKEKFQPVLSVSSPNIPFDVMKSPLKNRNTAAPPLDSFESIRPAANGATVYNQLPPDDKFERNDAEEFGRYVAQSLVKLPTSMDRRQLEIQIETAILNAKKNAFR